MKISGNSLQTKAHTIFPKNVSSINGCQLSCSPSKLQRKMSLDAVIELLSWVQLNKEVRCPWRGNLNTNTFYINILHATEWAGVKTFCTLSFLPVWGRCVEESPSAPSAAPDPGPWRLPWCLQWCRGPKALGRPERMETMGLWWINAQRTESVTQETKRSCQEGC